MTDNKRKIDDATKLAHRARGGIMPKSGLGTINPPVYRASTLTFPTVASLTERAKTLKSEGKGGYGRYGSDTVWDFEDMLAELDDAAGAVVVESGYAAVTLAMSAFVKTGDHMLVCDSVYGPARGFADGFLKRFGVEITYFDPLISLGDLEALFKPNTKVIYFETPGSITFELQDVAAFAELARRKGSVSIIDNTWATPLLLKPLALGVDVVVQAGTKYIVGHSDAMLGVVTANEACIKAVKDEFFLMGHHAAPDAVALAARGIRTMAVRLAQHQTSGLAVAAWLEKRPEVAAVLHPALPSHPQHDLYKKQFKGASGLFSIVLKPEINPEQVALFCDGLQLFSMGYSWGGYESLIVPQYPGPIRTASAWPPAKQVYGANLSGQVLRIHIGLEAVDDLIADLELGFNRINDPARKAQTRRVLGGLFGRRA